jgi:phosphopantothenoylcysteine decarboxylase/phosphopantothenate--cysteine ligase
MGYALAEAAQRRGAHVILVSGPTELKIPDGVDWVPVRATEQMHRTVLERAREANVAIMAAAVSDYRPAASQDTKIKRGSGGFTLELEPTPDILAALGREKGNRVLVGFAAETNSVAENARGKLARKGADMIVANDVTQEGAGFDTDTNIVTLYLRDGREIPLPKMSKLDVADRILDQVLEIHKQSK